MDTSSSFALSEETLFETIKEESFIPSWVSEAEWAAFKIIGEISENGKKIDPQVRLKEKEKWWRKIQLQISVDYNVEGQNPVSVSYCTSVAGLYKAILWGRKAIITHREQYGDKIPCVIGIYCFNQRFPLHHFSMVQRRSDCAEIFLTGKLRRHVIQGLLPGVRPKIMDQSKNRMEYKKKK